jgi:hypothetical protein
MDTISIGRSLTRSFKMPDMALREWMRQGRPKGFVETGRQVGKILTERKI